MLFFIFENGYDIAQKLHIALIARGVHSLLYTQKSF